MNATDQIKTNTTTAIHVSTSPHIRREVTTARIMTDVLIALLPACLMGVFAFGYRALLVLLVTVASCLLTELVYQKLMKLPVTVSDMSAVVTGVIITVNMPATIPLWMPALGGVFAILVVKQLFGGLGHNIMNPALAARCFLLISFAAAMTTFPDTFRTLFDGAAVEAMSGATSAADAVSGATPLAQLKSGGEVNIFNMIFNTHNGCIGEAYPPAILLGGIYLVARKVISIRIPGIYILSTLGFVCLIQLISGNTETLTAGYLVAQACGGGLLLGAIFLATDYVTCPITPWGQVIFALLLGLLTAMFRVLGGSSEGVSYAIIIGNLMVPLIEKITMPKPFGVVRKGKRQKQA